MVDLLQDTATEFSSFSSCLEIEHYFDGIFLLSFKDIKTQMRRVQSFSSKLNNQHLKEALL